MTAYQLTPVGAAGPEPGRARRIEVLSYRELVFQNEQLRAALEAAMVDVDRAHVVRLETQHRLNRAMRVLAAFERLTPAMRRQVAAAREEIWRLDS